MPLLAYGAIDDKLEILYGCMVVQTVCVSAIFLSFMESVTITTIHNMLDSRFKGLKCFIDFRGHDKAKLLVVEYDNKILIPLLVKCSYFLNPDVVSTYTSTIDGPSNSSFDTPISSVEADEGLLLVQLSFFHCCAMNLSDDARSPLL